MAVKKRGLGKNLNALLFSMPDAQDIAQEMSYIEAVPIRHLQPGKYQPRRDMNRLDLESLANSVRAQGVIQPVIVRRIGGSEEHFEIIAGERRFRAAQLAGLESVPVVIKDISDQAAMAMALIENIQREDLTPLEEAYAFERLLKEFSLTHAEVAEMVGKSRASISNSIRLLNLNDTVKTLLEQGDIEVGHAKVMLSLEESLQLQVATKVVEKGLSVRETEKIVAQLQNATEDTGIENKGYGSKPLDPDIVRLQNSLSDKLGAPIHIVHNAQGKGKIVIHYNSLDELDGVLAHLDPSP